MLIERTDAGERDLSSSCEGPRRLGGSGERKVRKDARWDPTSFRYERSVQLLPKLGRWVGVSWTLYWKAVRTGAGAIDYCWW